MRKNVILIDFESVQPKSIDILPAEHFYVCVFVGTNQKRVPFKIVEAIQRMGTRAEYIKITGNGLTSVRDFPIMNFPHKSWIDYWG